MTVRNSLSNFSHSYGVPTLRDLLKYLLEGIAVSVAAYFLSSKTRKDLNSVLLIGLSAAVIFYLLDQFAPLVVGGARQGAGFGIGFNLVGGKKKKAAHKDEDSEDSHDSHDSHDSKDDSETEDTHSAADSEEDTEESFESGTESFMDAEEFMGAGASAGVEANDIEAFDSCQSKEKFVGYPLNPKFD
jgi:hypothetical protein